MLADLHHGNPSSRLVVCRNWARGILRAENKLRISTWLLFDVVDSIESCSVQEKEKWFDEEEDSKRWCCKTDSLDE
jgi:hypothetical protein